MLTAERCKVRAAECQRMAAQAPNARVQDILIDMARTWMRLALEAEQWTQMNRPSTRLTKAAPKNAAGEPIKLTPLPTGAGCTTHTSTSRFGLAGPLLGRHTWSRDVVRGVDKGNVRKSLGEVPH